MSTFVSITAEKPPVTEQPRVTPIREDVRDEAVSRGASLRDEQIQALVEQLFFRPESGPVRYVGFAASDPSTQTAQLCLEVARVLAEEGRYNVGLVDASPDAVPLQTQLDVAPTVRPEATWPIAPRLWLVPRQSWSPSSGGQRIPEQSFSRLRELTMEFDFAILYCPSVSWLTTRIGHACDGLVLVLTANKTRRLVAAQMKDLLRHAQVPLLGTVLTERRLPVPEGLYRKL
jgi:Mrp family chromosome partitioning ATPase